MKDKKITINDLALMMGKGFDGVDKKFELMSKQFEILDYRMDMVEKRMEKMEERFNQKFDKLITTIDKFLKRLIDTEDEFTMMRNDINRMKKVIREKLGVELS